MAKFSHSPSQWSSFEIFWTVLNIGCLPTMPHAYAILFPQFAASNEIVVLPCFIYMHAGHRDFTLKPCVHYLGLTCKECTGKEETLGSLRLSHQSGWVSCRKAQSDPLHVDTRQLSPKRQNLAFSTTLAASDPFQANGVNNCLLMPLGCSRMHRGNSLRFWRQRCLDFAFKPGYLLQSVPFFFGHLGKRMANTLTFSR